MDKNNYINAAEALLNSISPKAKEALEQIKLSSEFNKAAENFVQACSSLSAGACSSAQFIERTTYFSKLLQDSFSKINTLTINPDAVSSLNQLYRLSDYCNEMISKISPMASSLVDALHSIDFNFDFLRNENSQDNFIELTDEDCNSINAILESANCSDDTPPKVTKGKITTANFIMSALIPVLTFILSTLLTLYLHKVDSIDSQKRHIEELQLREKELQLKEDELRIMEQQLQYDMEQKEILENILIEFQNQSEYYKSLQSTAEYPSDVPASPAEIPELFDETEMSPEASAPSPDDCQTSAEPYPPSHDTAPEVDQSNLPMPDNANGYLNTSPEDE